MDMDVADIQILYARMLFEMNSPKGQENKQVEVLEDAMVHGEV